MPLDETQLAEEYRERILYYVYRRLGNRSAAEELTQEVLIAVIAASREDRINNQASLGSFVFGVAKNLVRKWFRDLDRDERRNMELVHRPTGMLLDPEATFLAQEERRLVEDGIRTLSSQDRTILQACFDDPVPLTELANKLGLSHSALRKRKSRALARLRSLIEKVTDSV